MAGVRITQEGPHGMPISRYGGFGGKTPGVELSIAAAGEWSVPVNFEPGDQWYVTLALAAVDAPEVIITMRQS